MLSKNPYDDFDTCGLPKVIDPDDPSRKLPRHEMCHLALLITPDEAAAIDSLAMRVNLTVGELGLRALAYGLTVFEVLQSQEERKKAKH